MEEIEKKNGSTNGRIEKLMLRARALDRQSRPDLCAQLEEESYAETARLPQVIRRAKALEKILMGVDIVINDGEMIVGEQTSVGSPAHTEAHFQRGIPKTGYLIPDFAKALKGSFEGIKSSVEEQLLGMVDAMVHAGYALQDALDYALIGCHEPTVPGRTVGKPAANPGYFSFASMTQNAISRIEDFQSFDELFSDFSEQMAQNIRNVVITQNHQDNMRCQLFPQPLFSSLMSDCIAKGIDLSEGGCRYNFSGFQGIGLATAADSLAVVKKLVFEEKSIEKRELLSALENNFEGYEVLRQRLLNDAPKWGNDDDYVDDIAIAIVEAYRQEVNKYTNFRGGKFIPALWSFYVNIDFGRGLGASADGRKAGEPVSHSIGPSTGAGANGPTAILKSCAKLPHRRLANGTSLLLDFQPFLLRKTETVEKFKSFVKSAMYLGLMQLHCNIINTDKLEEAKLHPELYGDLIVRVAGYSDYFVRLSEPLQNFVIERSKHEI